jgi:GTP:adenosylcobinamide-phosphate guanylyltransferase
MHALITAGGIPKSGEYLYKETLGKPKALLDIHGKPMIQWVLDAVSGSRNIDEIFIIGLCGDTGLVSTKPIHYIDDQHGALENAIAGAAAVVKFDPHTDVFLMSSSDIPALTTEMVDWVVDQAEQAKVDLHYFVIRRQDMEKRYPESRRTYTHFKDAELCSADIFLLRAEKALNPAASWRNLLSARKSPLKQASIIGFDILLLMLLRRITLQGAVKKVVKRLDMTGRVCFTPYPEMGMDVDKDFQLEIIRKDLAVGRR